MNFGTIALYLFGGLLVLLGGGCTLTLLGAISQKGTNMIDVAPLLLSAIGLFALGVFLCVRAYRR